MKITVKKTHIRRGAKGLPDSCAIALAIKEQLGTNDVSVSSKIMKIGKKVISLPSEAVDFIAAFDDNKSSVEPFEFEI